MWCRYSVVPILPQLLSMRYDIEDKTINALYSQYIAMLQSSMSNSQIQVVMDLDSVLSYCAVLDQFGKSDKALLSFINAELWVSGDMINAEIPLSARV